MTPEPAHSNARRLVVLALLTSLISQGCSTAPIEQPGAHANVSSLTEVDEALERLTNPENTNSRRLAAARTLRGAAEHPASGRALTQLDNRERLKTVLWKRSESPLLRVAVYDILTADPALDPDSQRLSELLLPTEARLADTTPVIAIIADTAVDRGWTSLTPALVRSWSVPIRGIDDAERPEPDAIAALNADLGTAGAVWQVLTGELRDSQNQPLPEAARTAAWDVLVRTNTADTPLRQVIAATPAQATQADPLTETLAAGLRDLDLLPAAASELEWLSRLYRDHPRFWTGAQSALAPLSPEQREALALRHLPAIMHNARFAPERLSRTREQLLTQLDQALEPRRAVWRSRDTPGGLRPESLDEHRDNLTWGDLLLITTALDLVTNAPSPARRALFDIAERDMKDTSTEHGGILDADDEGNLAVFHYPPRPRDRASDRRMIASDDLINASSTTLFHFHLHAQRYNNTDYAGPSTGDLAYARLHQRSCIVLTFLDADTLNADYYQPNGAIIDLGSITRPN